MGYYTAINDYPAFGYTAPWYWRTISAAYNEANGQTLITNEVGYEGEVLSDQIYVPGVITDDEAPDAVMSHIVAYQNSTGPHGGVGGGGFPKKH